MMVSRIYTPYLGAAPNTAATNATLGSANPSTSQGLATDTTSGNASSYGGQGSVLTSSQLVGQQEELLQTTGAIASLQQAITPPTAPKASATPATASTLQSESHFLEQSAAFLGEPLSKAPPLAGSQLAGGAAPAGSDLNLQTLNLQQQGKRLSTGAIVADFWQTAKQLGLPAPLQQQVLHGLKTAEHLARQSPVPSALLKDLLGHLATPLDAHIAKQLGEPSAVVKDWLEALLQQPIDWSAGGAAANLPATLGAATDAEDALLASTVGSEVTQKSQWKQDVASQLALAKQALAKEDWPAASALLEQVQDRLKTQGYEGADLLYKLHYLSAKAQAGQHQPHKALFHLHQAEQQLPRLQRQPNPLPAQLFSQQGELFSQVQQWLPAELAFEKASRHKEGYPVAMAQHRLQAAFMAVEGKRLLKAESHLSLAQDTLEALPPQRRDGADAALLLDVLQSKADVLQRLNKPPQREETLLAWVREAQRLQEAPAVAAGLRQLAAHYAAQGQNPQALKVLETLEQLG